MFSLPALLALWAPPSFWISSPRDTRCSALLVRTRPPRRSPLLEPKCTEVTSRTWTASPLGGRGLTRVVKLAAKQSVAVPRNSAINSLRTATSSEKTVIQMLKNPWPVAVRAIWRRKPSHGFARRSFLLSWAINQISSAPRVLRTHRDSCRSRQLAGCCLEGRGAFTSLPSWPFAPQRPSSSPSRPRPSVSFSLRLLPAGIQPIIIGWRRGNCQSSVISCIVQV